MFHRVRGDFRVGRGQMIFPLSERKPKLTVLNYLEDKHIGISLGKRLS